MGEFIHTYWWAIILGALGAGGVWSLLWEWFFKWFR